MEEERTTVSLSESPFGITLVLLFLICVSTSFTSLIPSTRGELIFATLTAPFNVFVEGNFRGNVVVLLFIVAIAELYMKATYRGVPMLIAFVSSVVATYAVSYIINVTAPPSQWYLPSGTSIIGASILLFLIIVIMIDLALWSKKLMERKKSPIKDAVTIAAAFALTILVVRQLASMFFAFYITDNESARLHEMGSAIAIVLTAAILIFREWTMPHSRSAQAKADGNLSDLPRDF
jgi:hypothetical protein